MIAVLVVLLAAAGWQIAMMAKEAAELEEQSAFLDEAFEAEIDQANQELAAAQSRIKKLEAQIGDAAPNQSQDAAATNNETEALLAEILE
ncbi:MAG: hypothetical protein CMO26_06905, partial [Thiotrichales bacterium]|nr:hypothetical protein [Thiotrichales bacterium]